VCGRVQQLNQPRALSSLQVRRFMHAAEKPPLEVEQANTMEHDSDEPIQKITEEEGLEFTALQKFMLRSTVPVMVEIEEKKPLPQGTGTLFRINDRHFIITARHVFESKVELLSHLALPDDLEGKGFTRILNAVNTVPKDDIFDVAAIEITNQASVEAIKQNWNFLTLDNVRLAPPTTPVWVVGYPEGKTRFEEHTGKLIIEPVTIVTELLPIVPIEAEPPVHQGLDLFFLYEKTAQVAGRGIEETPKMLGVSGASIWELIGQPPKGELWVPERFVKSVAVQSSYRHSKYLRGKSWLAVAKLLAKIDSELKEAIFANTGIIPDDPPA
jgi:hypothetical protein